MTDAETPHELVLVARFAASPKEVWAAWTEPERFAEWWCAPDWTVSDIVMEVRPRGRFHEVQTSPDGEIVMPFDGFYRAVEAPERLVFTLTDAEARTVLTVLLRAADGGTEQEFHQTGVITDEHFEALKAGTQTFFARLADYLAR
jgi:uncharacterized protein YndB with AHSA1/START domain